MVLTAEHEIHGEESDPEIRLLPLYILRPHAPDHNQYQHFDESGPLFALISMHRTVLRHEQVVIQRCQSCCCNYHCPFCGPKVFKPTTELHVVKNHVSNHLSLAVQHQEFLIVKCNLQCRVQAHFHCCYCSKTVIRKVQIIKHLQVCSKRQVPPTETVETAAFIEPVASSEPIIPSEPIISNEEVSFKEPAVAEGVSLPVKSLAVLKNVRIQKKVQCVHCGVTINKKNLDVHVKRKHTKKICDVTENRHLPSQCIDPVNGIYAVEKSFYRPCSVIHVQKKTSCQHPVVKCETDECSTNAELAKRSGFQHFECMHMKSLQFCPWPNRTPVVLEEDVLLDMISANVFGEPTKTSCMVAKAAASAAGVPLSVELTIGGPSTKKYISVYENKVSYYSRLGRVIASYDSTRNTWHCPCAKPRRSCLHKNIARWHLFQVQRQLFTSSPIARPAQGLVQEHAFQESTRLEYPPSGEGLKQMVYYLMKNKTLPAELPQKYITGSMTIKDIPKHLVPKETVCSECTGNVVLSEPVLITSKGKCITYTGIVEGFSTYYRMCSNCGLKYRYQEWTDGLHNFDDHLLMSLHMCVVLRHSLQTHHAISRAVEVLETTTQQKFPRKEKILHAYMHFEALTDHDYAYSCVKCGYHPAVVVMDLHKKAAFNMPVSEIPPPPPEYDGQVNLKDFWTSVTAEVVCRGLLGSALQNPFLVSPSYHYWAPWIGPNTRREDIVLNTEYAKMHAPRPATEDAELQITEERLEEVLTDLKVDVVRRLCKQCGLDPSGSKMDLVLRLRQEMRNRSSYDKVFQKVWGASGGWAVITCPCGVVYSLKFLLRAESPRDYADCLLSFKHFPNVNIYDFARGLATHTNLREPECIPFRPYEGRLKEPTPENIKLAVDGQLKVNLLWLKEKKDNVDPDCHPVTGSAEHYALYDLFHENNTKDARDALRKIQIVPELAGWVNSQCAEQLFSDMRKNNYFLNTLTPSGHIFMMRNILQHYNTKQNKKIEDGIRKIVPQNAQLHLDVHGQIIMVATPSDGTPAATASDGTPAATASDGTPAATPSDGTPAATASDGTPAATASDGTPAATASDGTPAATASDGTPAATPSDGTPAATPSDGTPAATASDGTPAATASDGTDGSVARLMHAEREIKDFRRWEGPKTLHDFVLDCTKPQDEVVCSVGTTVLRRADCVGLGTNCELEATVVNCCLSLICYLAGQKGLDVLAVDSYVLACWSPPQCVDPFESLPVSGYYFI
ncbi:hypothetical protein F2P79_006441 [Pimephales promelas]|nr:hypothetical protein F2P79_006441 [Pimephales promelas]KAG1958035.1 hypothetical protein F2P79_006441 [Pimephales promelas]KAG1958036.1 hypothetical protein F2P79_006441 [Pimephales promelas]